MIFAEDVLIRVGICWFLMVTICIIGIVCAVILKYVGYAKTPTGS